MIRLLRPAQNYRTRVFPCGGLNVFKLCSRLCSRSSRYQCYNETNLSSITKYQIRFIAYGDLFEGDTQNEKGDRSILRRHGDFLKNKYDCDVPNTPPAARLMPLGGARDNGEEGMFDDDDNDNVKGNTYSESGGDDSVFDCHEFESENVANDILPIDENALDVMGSIDGSNDEFDSAVRPHSKINLADSFDGHSVPALAKRLEPVLSSLSTIDVDDLLSDFLKETSPTDEVESVRAPRARRSDAALGEARRIVLKDGSGQYNSRVNVEICSVEDVEAENLGEAMNMRR